MELSCICTDGEVADQYMCLVPDGAASGILGVYAICNVS